MTALLRKFWFEPPVRAVLLLTALMLSVLAGGTAFLMYDMRQRELEYARSEISTLSRILAEQTARTLDGVTMALRGAQDRLSDEIGQQLELDSFPVMALLKARAEGLPQYSSMFVLDTSGVVMNSTLLGTRPGFSEADRDYFTTLARQDEGVIVSQLYRRRFDGEWTFYLSARLADRSGNFRGVVAAAVVVNYFESFYRRLDLRFGKQIQLINARGNLVASFPSDMDRVDQPVKGAPTFPGAADPAGTVVVTETVEGVNRFVAYHPVPRYPFLIGVVVDQDSALVSWPMTARPIVLGAGIVAVLLLAASCGVLWSMRRRALMARALEDSEERLRGMVESVMDAIVTIDEDLSVVLFNRAAEHMFGVQADDALGKPFDRLLAGESRGAYHAIVGRRRNSGEPHARRGRAELTARHADGREFSADATFSSTETQGRRFLTVVLRDLTERKRIETHLRETNRQLQELSTALQRVREDERAGIAREMHDELGQRLTAIKLELSWLGGRLPGERADLQDKVGAIKEQLNQTIASVRRITYELRPLILDDLGLRAAISWLTDDFSRRTGIELVLDMDDDEPERGSAEATTLFRVLQESLTNVTKYAQASTVWVAYRRDGDDWCLSVRDDGVGFVLDAANQAGFGLLGMRERIRLVQGTFAIHSTPGDGTAIDATVPAGQ
ncbi:PAS domain S-box protein [Aromatoleum toluvorans]|uniref:PAS domain S-box protein n=1 Tax=Aromatoleum toluvorans TaxID=92002 RepID=A0ABX1PZH9_9RHOO|nr:PAS domain S-box protein [Aromatoleum toluvorans]NMG43901.1 PAS domain S-box protein [Aromatoleum toluvorans]